MIKVDVLQIRRANWDNLGIIFKILRKTYTVTPHKNHLTDKVQLRCINICFC